MKSKPKSKSKPAAKPTLKSSAAPATGRVGQPPPWALTTMSVIIGVILLIVLLGQTDRSLLRAIIPISDSGYFWIGLLVLPFVAIVALAVASKVFQWRKAAAWTQTTGRIIRAGIETRRHRFGNEAETVTNVPMVEYEFAVDGRNVRGSRIAIGDDSGGANSEATLARYRAGAEVAVFYDPSDPANCVLERDAPLAARAMPTAKSLAGILAVLALLGGAVAWLIVRGPGFIAAHFPKAAPGTGLPIAALCFGLAALAFFVTMRRMANKAAHWPSVPGQIVRSEVESFRKTIGGDRVDMMQHKIYRPVVEYAYAVQGRDYRGNTIKLFAALSGTQPFAEKLAAKYPAGRAVTVHYDPADPGTAALENPTGLSWLVPAVALGFFALAASRLGLFG